MVISYFLRRHAPFVFITILFTSLTCVPAAAAPLAPPPPDAENRSLIIGVDAGAVTAAKPGGKETRAAALSRGQKSALEKARDHLGELGKAGLDFDLVRMPSKGFVMIVGQKEVKTGKDARPHLWLETEAGFVLKNRKTGNRPDAALLDRADLLDVRIWTDRKEYWEGETVTLNLLGNRDFYGKVVQIDVKGKIRQLLPNNYRQMSVFEKDQRYLLPDEGDRYQLAVRPPFGVIRFIVYATRLPMSHVNLKTIIGGIYEYPSSRKAFGRSVRHVIPAGEEKMTEFYEAVWDIKILPRK